MAIAGYTTMYYYTEARRLKRVLRFLMLDKGRKQEIQHLKSTLNTRIEEAAEKLGV
jgi:hypothetical protein